VILRERDRRCLGQATESLAKTAKTCRVYLVLKVERELGGLCGQRRWRLGRCACPPD